MKFYFGLDFGSDLDAKNAKKKKVYFWFQQNKVICNSIFPTFLFIYNPSVLLGLFTMFTMFTITFTCFYNWLVLQPSFNNMYIVYLTKD